MSVYRLTHWQRLVKRPFEHAIALILIYTGIYKSTDGSPLLHELENPLVQVGWVTMSILTGSAIIAGLHWPGPTLGRAVERIGHFGGIMTLLGGISYAVTLPGLGLSAAIQGGFDEVALSAAMALRIYWLWDEGRAYRKARAIAVRVHDEGVG